MRVSNEQNDHSTNTEATNEQNMEDRKKFETGIYYDNALKIYFKKHFLEFDYIIAPSK